MKRFLIIVLLFIAFVAAVSATPVHAQLSFGGNVSLVSQCNTGFLYLVPPYGMFMFLKPPMGLQVLGLSATAPVPCVLGIVPMGSGLQVLLSN